MTTSLIGSRSRGARTLALSLAAIVLGATDVHSAHAQTVQFPGYTLSLYRDQLPGGDVAAMTINPASGALYYVIDDPNSHLYVIPTAGRTIRSTSGGVPGGFAYEATDIEYVNGSVYMAANGVLNRFVVSTFGPATPVATLPQGFTFQGGLAHVGDTLYISGGSSNPGRLTTYSISTGTLSQTMLPAPVNASSLEYDPVRNRLYIASNFDGGNDFVGYYWLDLQNNSLHTLIPPAIFGIGAGNFAVDPNGMYLYARYGPSIQRINVDTGEVVPFITDLQFVYSFADCVFGPSSSGTGWSMYLGDMGNIREVQGFVPAPGPSAAFGIAGIACLVRRRRRGY
jgi:hypothetical protein